MKKPENTIIKIQDKEFVVSEAAQVILVDHIRAISRTYRLNPRAKKELLNALRDLLLELPHAKQKTISEKTARSVIHIAGSNYENESRLQPLKDSAFRGQQVLSRNFRRYVLTEKVRRNIFYLLSVVMLIPIGLTFGSMEVFTPEYPLYDNTTPNVTQTTLGPVKSYDRSSDTTTSKDIDNYWPRQYSTIFLTIVAVVLSVLFYLLAIRSPKVKLVGAILVVAIVSSITVSDAESRNLSIASSVWSKQTITEIPSVPRTESNLDILYACGADIRYVFLDGSDGIFYTLRDAGYSLNQEIPGGIEPEKDKLCKLYDSLRKEMPNERIVLMSYVRDADGIIRPYDNTATYDQLTISKELAKQRYGFFVKESK